jgi:hypothetical protein
MCSPTILASHVSKYGAQDIVDLTDWQTDSDPRTSTVTVHMPHYLSPTVFSGSCGGMVSFLARQPVNIVVFEILPYTMWSHRKKRYASHAGIQLAEEDEYVNVYTTEYLSSFHELRMACAMTHVPLYLQFSGFDNAY